ncbi:MAG TPA: MFS transporter [Bryobacteraceae bacterium]|nr:MFS transporter [Bryobacteraceae bacterium]
MSSRAAFAYPNFRYFLLARFLVVASTEMQAVAVAWQVYGLTHRPLDLGLVGLAQFLPGPFLFLLAGHAADRFPRQRILATCFAGFAVCSLAFAALTLRHGASVWPIYLVLLGNGCVRVFNGPAGQSLLPLLVPESDFPNAVAWSASVFTGSTIVGPMIGGLLYGFTGTPLPVYAGAAVAYVGALALVGMIRVKVGQTVSSASAGRPNGLPHQSWGTVLEGLRFIRRNRLVAGAITLDLFAVLLGGAVALLPAYANDILHIGAKGLGLLRSAPGAGAMTMATVLAHRPIRRRAGALMLWSVAGFGIFTVVFGLSRSAALSVAALVLVGACDMVSVVVRQTMIQLGTPDRMRGRVSAVNMIFVGASNELGQFESGVTAQWFGMVPAVVLGGLGTLAVVAAWTGLFPALRRVDELTGDSLAARGVGNAAD